MARTAKGERQPFMNGTGHHVSGSRRFAANPDRSSSWCALALTLAVAAGCRGPQGGPSAAAPSGQQPPVPWARMTPQQKYDYMRSAVMPEMRALFARFDPHRYAEMGCSPCHARGPGNPDYLMPNDDLLLDPSACVEVPGSDPSVIAMSHFMDEQVGPTMARLLGKPWNSCFWCHSYDH